MASRLATLLLVALASGCGSAVNYLDPDGPLHTSSHGRPLDRAPTAPLRVVSFNIAHAKEIDLAIEVLRDTPSLRGADILALQEMDAPGAERIAEALGMNAVYFASGIQPGRRNEFGCAILSPWPLVEPRKLVLPHGARGSGFRRSATSAVVVRGGLRVRAYSVHLPSPQGVSGGSRRDQLRTLARDASSSDIPVVIAGDFNSYGKLEVLADAGFEWVTRDLGGTRPFRLLGIRLFSLRYDHCLARGLRRLPGHEAAGVVSDNRGASDHRPIWALLAPENPPAER